MRVLVADDFPLVRDGLAGALVRDPDIEVVGLAVDGVDALEKARALDPEPDPEVAASDPPPVDAVPRSAPPEPPPAEPAAEAPLDDARAVGILTGVLDDLGAAHHRPFSRG